MRRQGGLDSVSAAVTDLTGAMRRARRSRDPRVRLHLDDGEVVTLDPAAAGDALLEVAESMVELRPPSASPARADSDAERP